MRRDARQVRQRQGRRRARQTTHGQLALAADVEDVGAECDADPDGDEKERGGLHGRGAERVAAVECPDDEGLVAADGIGPESQHHGRAEEQCHDEGHRKGEPAQQETPPVPPSIRQSAGDDTHDRLAAEVVT